jgi:transcription elongation GreA/GreB family factor
MESFKTKVYNQCLVVVNERLNFLQKSISELMQGAANESKSSAGDKHETARAMMQLEQEKLTAQLGETIHQKNTLEKISTLPLQQTIAIGSLIKTNKGYLYFSIPIGKINVDGKDVMALSIQSPLGKKLMGLSVNEKAELNTHQYIIEEIF